MKRKNNKVLFFTWLVIFHGLVHAQIPWVSFQDGMASKYFNRVYARQPWKAIYNLCELNFQIMQEIALLGKKTTNDIPKIIHQIWLGDEHIPEDCLVYMKTWQKFHPHWQYCIWTDKDIEHCDLINKGMFDAVRNPAQKADILRYEILAKYGGVYVDVDMECIKPLDELCETFDFFVGMQPLDTGYAQLGIGIIGACPHHPLLQKAIQALPQFAHHKLIVLQTGPIFFTHVICQYLPSTQLRDIVMPSVYFYPCGYTDRQEARKNWIKPSSYTIHHWKGSWLHLPS